MVPIITWDRRPSDLLVFMGTRGAHIFVCPARPRPFLVIIWLVAPSNGIGAEKVAEYFEALDDLYSLCEFQQNRPKGLREIRDRAKFFFLFLFLSCVTRFFSLDYLPEK